MRVELNAPVPEFRVPVTPAWQETLTEIGPQDLLGHQWILYFYPKNNTPTCTQEALDFKAEQAAFQAANTYILGVSRDGLQAHTNFQAKHALNFSLCSDKQETLCRLFDVLKMKKNFGREYLGIERSTFLIDHQGILRAEWRKVKLKDHVAQVLAKAQTLHQNQ